jgi:hypothetical protein
VTTEERRGSQGDNQIVKLHRSMGQVIMEQVEVVEGVSSHGRPFGESACPWVLVAQRLLHVTEEIP